MIKLFSFNQTVNYKLPEMIKILSNISLILEYSEDYINENIFDSFIENSEKVNYYLI